MTTVSWLKPLKFESERTIARHTVEVGGSTYAFCLAAPGDLSRRTIGEALAGAVAELRAVDTAFSPFRQRSLVSLIRRGELTPAGYPPPLVEVVRRCAALRAATDGWFDAWALPGGFDPSGMAKGWAIDRAAVLLRAAGIDDYAITSGGDWLVRGCGPRGGAWRVGVADPDNPLDTHYSHAEVNYAVQHTLHDLMTGKPVVNFTKPCSSAATGDAAAPSTTSLQRSITQIIASKISRSGSATMSST